jgi:hypothetical protein
MKAKLELSVREMMQLRNDGYSNKDIARILDISLPTVYKYIGKQGCHIPSATASFISKPTEEEPPTKAPEIAVISQVISVDGYLFEIPNVSSGMSVTFADGQLVKIDDVDRFFGAIKAAMEYKSGGERV